MEYATAAPYDAGIGERQVLFFLARASCSRTVITRTASSVRRRAAYVAFLRVLRPSGAGEPSARTRSSAGIARSPRKKPHVGNGRSLSRSGVIHSKPLVPTLRRGRVTRRGRNVPLFHESPARSINDGAVSKFPRAPLGAERRSKHRLSPRAMPTFHMQSAVDCASSRASKGDLHFECLSLWGLGHYKIMDKFVIPELWPNAVLA